VVKKQKASLFNWSTYCANEQKFLVKQPNQTGSIADCKEFFPSFLQRAFVIAVMSAKQACDFCI